MREVLAIVLIFISLCMSSTICASYSTSIAKEMGYLSEITHCSDKEISEWSCQDFTQNIKVAKPLPFQNSGRNTFGFIAYSFALNSVVVAWRGSEDIKNWMTNLDTVRTSYDACSGCSVHKGFKKAYDDISEVVRTLVRSYLNQFQSAKLMVTGHSLGGSLAALCALDLELNVHHVELVYTFGEPRVGNDKFVQFYNTKLPNSFRVINYADTVVHTPPKAFGFLHEGIEVWYNPRGMFNYVICASEDKKCANSISTLFFSTSDHALVTYITLQVNNDSSLFERLAHKIYNYITSLKVQWQTSNYSDKEIEDLEIEKLEKQLGISYPQK